MFWVYIPIQFVDLMIDQHSIYSSMPEPWHSHIKICLESNGLFSGEVYAVFCINDSKQIVSSAFISFPDSRYLGNYNSYAFIQHVKVEDNFRHKGHGSQLIEFIEKQILETNCSGILASCSDPDLTSQFYKRLGFSQVDIDPYLLKLDFTNQQQIVSVKSESIIMVRAITQYDIASVQTIMGQPHWEIFKNKILQCDPCEYEEEFCHVFFNNNALKSYLVNYEDSYMVAWILIDTDGEHIFTLCNDTDEIAILKHSYIIQNFVLDFHNGLLDLESHVK
jgi:GNAT superfamily N-acetyltransferase